MRHNLHLFLSCSTFNNWLTNGWWIVHNLVSQVLPAVSRFITFHSSFKSCLEKAGRWQLNRSVQKTRDWSISFTKPIPLWSYLDITLLFSSYLYLIVYYFINVMSRCFTTLFSKTLAFTIESGIQGDEILWLFIFIVFYRISQDRKYALRM